jgi:transposase
MEKYKSENLGHLGLVAAMCNEIGIAQTIDEWIPSDSKNKKISHGQCIVSLVLNGMGFMTQALYLAPDFFADKPVSRLLGGDITAQDINDDVLGRALDAVFLADPTKLYSILSSKIVKLLGLDGRSAHLDSTSFHDRGKYNSDQIMEKDSSVVQITKGYSRDFHPNANQIILDLIVENKAGIPILMKSASGNSSDKTTFREIINAHIDQLKNDHGVYYVIADSALYSKDMLGEIGDTLFITRVPETSTEAKNLISDAHLQTFTAIDDNYSFFETSSNYGGIPHRLIVVKSSLARMREEKTAIKNVEAKTQMNLKKWGQFQKQIFACPKDAQASFEKCAKELDFITIGPINIQEIQKFEKAGNPGENPSAAKIEYKVQATATPNLSQLHRAKNECGFFILATNQLDQKALSAADVLKEYKGQSKVEKGFRFLKDPYFFTSSLFLKTPERIMALMMVMTLSLAVYAALEYKIRENLAAQNQFFPDQKGKQIQNPTARWVFVSFTGIHILNIKDQDS